MSNTDTQQAHDVQRMCKQAERDHESRKLVALLERIQRQLAERGKRSDPQVEAPKAPLAAISAGLGMPRLPVRSSYFER
jgi:hypothetical protein